MIRSAVGEGVATATEVSTIAVIYTLIVGHCLYGGIRPGKFYKMLVETAALSGAILMILGTVSARAWAITQSGIVQTLPQFLTERPGGQVAFCSASYFYVRPLGPSVAQNA